MCRPLRSGIGGCAASRSPDSYPIPCGNTLNSTAFTRQRQRRRERAPTRPHPRRAGCMARTERRQKTMRLPKAIEAAVRAAEDKKADDIVILDLRKAAGFTDYFVICSGQ